MNADYPVFLSLAGARCLVAGLGKVGCRKLAGLLKCAPAAILALDMRPLNELDAQTRLLLENDKVEFASRSCQREDVENSFLVFACTGSKAENERIAALCQDMGRLCNCASNPNAGNFILPAIARSGNISVALSTGGASPMLARLWKNELASWALERAKMAWLLGQLRPIILSLGMESGANALLFEEIASSPLSLWLAEGNTEKCAEWLRARLPEQIHAQLSKIFSGYANAFS